MLSVNEIIQTSFNKPLIKVCGLTLLDQVNELNNLGVDFCGFIFYEKSKRFVSPHLTNQQIASISKKIKKVGVFVNETIENVLKIAEECKLDAIQLHGDEDVLYCKQIATSYYTIKAIGVNNQVNLSELLLPYESVVHAFLFDTKHESYGGTGKKFNWELFDNAKINLPFILSGGISPLDVGDIRRFTAKPCAAKLIAIDINSNFENKYGVKDIKTINNFVIDMHSSNLP